MNEPNDDSLIFSSAIVLSLALAPIEDLAVLLRVIEIRHGPQCRLAVQAGA